MWLNDNFSILVFSNNLIKFSKLMQARSEKRILGQSIPNIMPIHNC
jgi:hypothetical protein